MSRVVNTNSPGKQRNYHMRSCAELLRHLSQKQSFDDEARDMLAALYFSLQGVENTLDNATDAWEKRDYWIKVEQFRQKWAWVESKIIELGAILRAEDWNRVPALITSLIPHFSDITINKLMRSSELWEGKYQQFLAEKSR